MRIRNLRGVGNVVIIEATDSDPEEVKQYARENKAVDNGNEELFYVCLDDGRNNCHYATAEELVSMMENWAGSF